jgi:hypothetical protein
MRIRFLGSLFNLLLLLLCGVFMGLVVTPAATALFGLATWQSWILTGVGTLVLWLLLRLLSYVGNSGRKVVVAP